MSITQPAIILASGSPRRRELLAGIGLAFSVITSGVDEEIEDEFTPGDIVVELAERKARAVAKSLSAGLVIGSDTTVAIDGEILNKPEDDADARRMLRLLRGRSHEVWTGVAMIDAATGQTERSTVRSLVRMRSYTDEEIEAYVAKGEPLDKAGAYAIQGGAGVFIEGIDGCYANVVGLPLCELSSLLDRFDIQIETAGPVCRRPNGEPCPRL